MVYQINPSKLGFSISEFMWRDLKLDLLECILYSIILTFKDYHCDIKQLQYITGYGKSAIYNRLKRMVDEEIISVSTVNICGTKDRNVYVANYSSNGEINSYEILATLEMGKSKILEYYNTNPRHLRGKKASKHNL